MQVLAICITLSAGEEVRGRLDMKGYIYKEFSRTVAVDVPAVS